jgi:hypothetical protein
MKEINSKFWELTLKKKIIIDLKFLLIRFLNQILDDENISLIKISFKYNDSKIKNKLINKSLF